MVVVPSDRPTFEKLWEAKVLEFKICNTELTLSPIEMRVLQELK